LSGSVRHLVHLHGLSRHFEQQPTRYLMPRTFPLVSTNYPAAERADLCRLLYQLLRCQLPYEEALGADHNSPLVIWTLNDRAAAG
jgi:hypothetical protein